MLTLAKPSSQFPKMDILTPVATFPQKVATDLYNRLKRRGFVDFWLKFPHVNRSEAFECK